MEADTEERILISDIISVVVKDLVFDDENGSSWFTPCCDLLGFVAECFNVAKQPSLSIACSGCSVLI